MKSPKFKYVAKSNQRKYGIKTKPAFLEILENSIILNKTKISKSNTIIKAKPIFFNPKNTGDQEKLTNN